MKAICVECWGEDAVVTLDMDGTGQFRCRECDAEYTCEDVRAKLEAMQKGWGKLLAWAESFPAEEVPTA